MNFFGFEIGGKSEAPVENALKETNEKKSLQHAILLEQKFRFREDLRTLENAIDCKNNIVNYNREEIHRIYRKCLQDSHIASQWNTRKLKTLKKEFFVVPKGSEEPNDELTELLRAPWFYSFLDSAMDSIAWGFSLIEFGPWTGEKFEPIRMSKTGKIHPDVMVIERDNVKPEYGIVVHTPGNSTGLDYTKDKYRKQTIFVGGLDDGWLYEIVKPYLIKDNTLKNWSEFSELFGMDVRVMKTEATGDDLRTLKSQLQTVVGGGNMLLGLDESMEYIGTGRSDAYNVFKQLADSQDSAMSKRILGQDVISNNTGQVVGTVGENVANMYGDSDARRMKFLVEDKLFPLLIEHGVKFENMTFEWSNKENLSLSERADIDLKVSQMGMSHEADYINETYDTRVEETENKDAQRTQNALKEIYNVTSKSGTTVN